jgi:hypothetical protein
MPGRRAGTRKPRGSRQSLVFDQLVLGRVPLHLGGKLAASRGLLPTSRSGSAVKVAKGAGQSISHMRRVHYLALACMLRSYASCFSHVLRAEGSFESD